MAQITQVLRKATSVSMDTEPKQTQPPMRLWYNPNYYRNERDTLDIHVHIHGGEVKEGKAPKSKQTPSAPVKRKAKREASAYAKEFGRQMKRLKRAHPRTAVKNLMKRAHSATKKARR